jgi:hypothetical protein
LKWKIDGSALGKQGQAASEGFSGIQQVILSVCSHVLWASKNLNEAENIAIRKANLFLVYV